MGSGDHAPGGDDAIRRRREGRLDGKERARVDDLAQQLRLPVWLRQRQVVRADFVGAQDLINGRREDPRIVAHLQRDQVQPELLYLADQPIQRAVGDALPAVSGQAVREQAQIGQ